MTHVRMRPKVALFAGLSALAGVLLFAISKWETPPAPQPAAVASPESTGAPSTPEWTQLTKRQKRALEPLAQVWATMPEIHKRTWLALSRNFAQMSDEEQIVLQGRMREWAALTPRQRTLARLNFADVKQLPLDEKRARWEAYQTLSPEEKQKLAREKPKTLIGAAPAIRPTPTDKLAIPPQANAHKVLPRIDTDQVAPSTLLPATTTASTTTPATDVPAPVSDASSAE